MKVLHTSRVAGFRWRLARAIAPAPILAAPLGSGPAHLLLHPDDRSVVWIAAKTLDMEFSNEFSPPTGDTLALGNLIGMRDRGTFRGTV